MRFKDYYRELGIEPSAGEAEIKQAYRRLARRFHPDVSREKNAEDRFKAINEAYDVLRDRQKRAEYDALRAEGLRDGQEFRPPPDYRGEAGSTAGFSEFFEAFFGARARQRSASAEKSRGAAARSRVELRQPLVLPLSVVHGGGEWRVEVEGRILEVKVPAGVRAGQVIRLARQAPGGGDLLLEVEYAPHPQFEVDGRNILYVLALPPWDAVLGTTVTVPTLGGPVDLRIPRDSDAGRKLRLRGRGLPGDPPGDQIVEIEITAPKPENEAQRALYRQLALAFGDLVS